MKTMLSKQEKVRNHLKKHKQITSWFAILKFRVTRLAVIISRLREEGMNIKTEMVYKNGVSYANYKLK